MPDRRKILLVATATSTAIMAGLFFAWSFSVMPGLAKLPDQQFIAAMQAMNRAIQNPLFFAMFFGAAVLLPLSAFFHFRQSLPAFRWLLIATVLYLAGVMGVTVLGNVPLNNALDSFDLSRALVPDMHLRRTTFESTWSRLNLIRTISSTLGVIFVTAACIYKNPEP